MRKSRGGLVQQHTYAEKTNKKTKLEKIIYIYIYAALIEQKRRPTVWGYLSAT